MQSRSSKAREGNRRRRRTSSPPREEPRPRSILDAQGRERPPFLLELEGDPDLDPIVGAFERGDYLFVRQAATRLANATSRPALRRAAHELLRRIEPDPLAKHLLFVAIGLLAFVVAWTYAFHQH